jgi:cytochrome c biogenesis protein CcdA
MRGKYRGLVVASTLLRVLAIVVMIVGIGWCVWSSIGSIRDGLMTLTIVLGICISLLTGFVVYSFAEVIDLLLDIRDEVRDKNSKKE